MLFRKHQGGKDAKWRWIGLAGKLFIDALFLGSRLIVRGYEPVSALIESRRCIYAAWHSRLLLPCYYYKGIGASALVSDSADGEIIAQILQRQGQTTVRGSTGKRGLRALTQQIRAMQANHQPGAVIPDGPQGPMQKVQPGVILLSKKTGCPIIPLSYSSKWRVVFNSWDRFMLPLPCSPAILIHGRPIVVPQDGSPRKLGDCVRDLEGELNRITDDADRFFGHIGNGTKGL